MKAMQGAAFLIMSMICALIVQQPVLACSSFLLKGGKRAVFGKNFDFFMKEGYLMVNKRGSAKTALLGPAQNPAKWIAKYGSITFNQVSKEYPFGGMNEAGLIVESMALEGANYPAPDVRTAVSELQWIQYQLDNCAAVGEVVETDERIRIAQGSVPVHFFVADRNGNAAAQGDGTVWSIVYDMKRQRILFRTVGKRDVRIVEMNAFHFDCGAPSLVLDLETPASGDVSKRFEAYSTELNRNLVRKTFARYREIKFMDLPEPAQEYLVRYPGKLECHPGGAE